MHFYSTDSENGKLPMIAYMIRPIFNEFDFALLPSSYVYSKIAQTWFGWCCDNSKLQLIKKFL